MSNNISITRSKEGVYLKLVDCYDGLVALELELDAVAGLNKMTLDLLYASDCAKTSCFVHLDDNQLEALYKVLKEKLKK